MISPTSFSGTLESPLTARSSSSRLPHVTSAAALDAELVRRFNTGDASAFDEIVGRYRGKMFSVALALLRNPADAEEISQDTFIRAYRGLAQFRGDSSLASWLHRITVNLARNRYWYFFRRHRQNTRSFDCPLSENSKVTFADLVASDVPNPAREATNHEFTAQVAACMEKLSPSQREILSQRNRLDRSYEEIAATLGLTLGTVKSRIARARKSLRALLVESYDGFKPAAGRSGEWFEPGRPAGLLDLISA